MSEPAVYYAYTDHVGVWRRLMIEWIDVSVAGLISTLLSVFAMVLVRSAEVMALITLVLWGVVWFAYFVVLKASRFRTLGYLAARARIVNLQGERPRFAWMFLRFLFALYGPIGLDLLWLSSDPHRQTLRDKFAHTFVIRDTARPAGVGQVVYQTCTVCAWTLLFADVRPDRT